MSHDELFAFEADFVATLRCVPMAVRFKLDRVGIKLSLRQWSRMEREDRQRLLDAPCETDADVESYHTCLCDLIRLRSREEPRMLDERPTSAQWPRHPMPDSVRRQAKLQGLREPSAERWSKLPELHRFALVKLSRDNHDNVNLGAAMLELGVSDARPVEVEAVGPCTDTSIHARRLGCRSWSGHVCARQRGERLVMLRPEIHFASNFPDDAVYGDDDFCETPGGRNIAETLKTALEQFDYRVSAPIAGGDHGWELDIWSGRQRLWVQVTVIDAGESYLIAEPFWFFPSMKLFRQFLADLKGILEADGRFKQLGWFPKGGSTRNVAPGSGPFDT